MKLVNFFWPAFVGQAVTVNKVGPRFGCHFARNISSENQYTRVAERNQEVNVKFYFQLPHFNKKWKRARRNFGNPGKLGFSTWHATELTRLTMPNEAGMLGSIPLRICPFSPLIARGMRAKLWVTYRDLFNLVCMETAKWVQMAGKDNGLVSRGPVH